MKKQILNIFANIVARIIPDSRILRYLVYLPAVAKWKKKHPETYPTFINRRNLYDYINNDLFSNGRVNYLEFGVYKGITLKYWSALNTCNESRFYGFDTFTGLPEAYDTMCDELDTSYFDLDGETPVIDDERVTFVKGLFQDTLGDFLKTESPAPPLIIHCDADLYSSTLFVLTRLNDFITPGTIIIFDDFGMHAVLHEFRALEDYCSSCRREYKIVGGALVAAGNPAQIAIEMK